MIINLQCMHENKIAFPLDLNKPIRQMYTSSIPHFSGVFCVLAHGAIIIIVNFIQAYYASNIYMFINKDIS